MLNGKEYVRNGRPENGRPENRPAESVQLTKNLRGSIWVSERDGGRRHRFQIVQKNRDPEGRPYITLAPRCLCELPSAVRQLCMAFARCADLDPVLCKQLAAIGAVLAQAEEILKTSRETGEPKVSGNGSGIDFGELGD